MKKFYTILATALVAVSASAQVYFVGDFQDWKPEAPTEATKNDDGSWTATLTNASAIKLATDFGSWEAFDAAGLLIEGSALPDNLGKTLNVISSKDNTNLPYPGDYTITVSADYKTAVITTTTPPPAGGTPLYIRGDMNSWGAPDLWKMSSEDGVTYWFDCQGETKITAGTAFKIADANWGAYNFGPGDEVFPSTQPIDWTYGGKDGIIADDYEGTIKCEILEDGNAKVTVHPTIVDHVAGVADITVSENEAVEYFNLQGIRVAAPENGLFIRRQGKTVTKVLVK